MGYSTRSIGFCSLNLDQQAILKSRLIREMRTNTYDAGTNRVTISPERAAAYQQLAAYYAGVFSAGRKEYAIPRGALTDAAKQRQMANFFWWTSWAASTNRLNRTTTYTNNWPHEPLVGNQPTSSAVLWSILSFVFLLAGVGGLIWYQIEKYITANSRTKITHGICPECEAKMLRDG